MRLYVFDGRGRKSKGFASQKERDREQSVSERDRERKWNESLKVWASSECVWRPAWAKNVSVTAALCICLAWMTPVTKTFPSSLIAALLFREPIYVHTISLSFSLSRPGNRLCVSLSRPGLSKPYDPDRTSQTVPLLEAYSAGQDCSCSQYVSRTAVPPLGTAIHRFVWQFVRLYVLAVVSLRCQSAPWSNGRQYVNGAHKNKIEHPLWENTVVSNSYIKI